MYFEFSKRSRSKSQPNFGGDVRRDNNLLINEDEPRIYNSGDTTTSDNSKKNTRGFRKFSILPRVIRVESKGAIKIPLPLPHRPPSLPSKALKSRKSNQEQLIIKPKSMPLKSSLAKKASKEQLPSSSSSIKSRSKSVTFSHNPTNQIGTNIYQQRKSDTESKLLRRQLQPQVIF
jgi:hypothetical protein